MRRFVLSRLQRFASPRSCGSRHPSRDTSAGRPLARQSTARGAPTPDLVGRKRTVDRTSACYVRSTHRSRPKSKAQPALQSTISGLGCEIESLICQLWNELFGGQASVASVSEHAHDLRFFYRGQCVIRSPMRPTPLVVTVRPGVPAPDRTSREPNERSCLL